MYLKKAVQRTVWSVVKSQDDQRVLLSAYIEKFSVCRVRDLSLNRTLGRFSLLYAMYFGSYVCMSPCIYIYHTYYFQMIRGGALSLAIDNIC